MSHVFSWYRCLIYFNKNSCIIKWFGVLSSVFYRGKVRTCNVGIPKIDEQEPQHFKIYLAQLSLWAHTSVIRLFVLGAGIRLMESCFVYLIWNQIRQLWKLQASIMQNAEEQNLHLHQRSHPLNEVMDTLN